MAGKIKNKIDDLKSSLERLSSRERRMVAGLGITFVLVVVFISSYLIQSDLETLEEENEAIRKALRDLTTHQDAFMVQRRRIAALEVRMSRTPLELNTFVESAASKVGVSIAESGEISPVEGERYTQRGVEIKLRKLSIGELALLMKELEGSPHIVQITKLSVQARWNQHEDLDVELVVSTFERNKKAKPERKASRGRTREHT